MGWIYSEQPAQAAGTYTTNQFQAAPTKITKETINLDHKLQAVIMDSANAKSVTGIQGDRDAKEEQTIVAKKLNIAANLVGVASTGVIGEPLPMDIIKKGISELELKDNDYVTTAILTTDKHAKTVSTQVDIAGSTKQLPAFVRVQA